MKIKASTYFALIILVFALAAIYFSLQITAFKGRFLPLALSIAIALFAALRIFAELREKPVKKNIPAESGSTPEPKPPGAANVRAILIGGGWFAGFCLAIWLIGWPLATFLFVAGYLLVARRGWTKAIALGLGMTIAVYVAFGFLMGIDMRHALINIPFYRFLP